MMRSLFSGVSGLKNHQTAMDVIGNNVANVNTIGYKANRVIFSDIVNQTIADATAPTDTSGGQNSKQVGLGVQISTIAKDMTEGSAQNTDCPLDFTIQGEGYFAVLSFDGTIKFTRNGNFATDRDGYLVTQSGEYVLGKLGTQNEINAIDASTLVPDPELPNYGFDLIRIVGDVGTVQAQDGAGNLVYEDKYGNQIIPKLSADGKLGYVYLWSPVDADGNPIQRADGTVIRAGDAVEPNEMVLQDRFGNKIAWDAAKGAYTYLDAPVGADGKPLMAGNPAVEVAAGDSVAATDLIYQDANGNEIVYDETANNGAGAYVYVNAPVDADGNRLYNDANNNGVQDAGEDFIGVGDVAVAVQNAAPGAGYEVAVDHDDMALVANMTEGRYLDYAIDTFGQVTCTDQNGDIMEIGRLLLATFNNPAGLDALGNSKYTTSANSGEAVFNFVGVECGNIQSGQLEMSNVSLATELTNMIIIQRGYQANSRVITTSDTLLEELVNLKR